MKRLILALLCLAPAIAPAKNADHDALRAFVQLATTCKASADNTTDAESFKAHSTVTKLARNGGKRLQLCELLDDEEAAKLCSEIQKGMEALEYPKRQIPVAQPVAQKPRTVGSLQQTIEEFKKRHDATMATPTTTRRLIERILLKTAVEVAYKKYKAGQGTSGNENADIPGLGQRWQSFRSLDHGNLLLRDALEYAAVRVFAHALADEMLPAGISTQKQKLLELAAPSLLAEVVHKHKRVTAIGLIMSVLPKMLMTRLYMDRKSTYYKYVDAAARVLPFLLGPTLFPYFKGKRTYNQLGASWQNTAANAMVDGFVSMAIFDGVPALMDGILPDARKKASRAALALNKKSRRKWTKNLVRDMTRQWLEALSASSFA